MKKVCLLSGMMVLGIASIDAAQRLTEEERRKIELVQWEKLGQQEELARPAIYKMIDPLVEKKDWPAIFAILDQMQGTIDVNEYRRAGIDGWLLLSKAVTDENFLAAKMLLEKYKANPNLKDSIKAFGLWNDGYSPFMYAVVAGDLAMAKLLLQNKANPNFIISDNKFSKGETPLIFACRGGDLAMVQLLLQYGANMYLTAEDGTDAFKAAKDYPEILKLLNKHARPAKAA
jgi:hypothetical protein